MIRLKRAYEAAGADDGKRVLVERLWPRGVRKASLRLDAWSREAAPSDDLRRWFGHDPAKWSEFQRRYAAELRNHESAWKPLLEAARRSRVTFVYSARDPTHNNAVALKRFLEARLKKRAGPGRRPSPRRARRSPSR